MTTIQRVLYELVGVDKASGAFDKAGMSASRMESRISKLGKGIAVTGGLIAGSAVVIGVESVKAATDFQTSMTKISTQAGGTRKDVQVLGKEVLALGTKTQQGPQELADSLYHLKSVGLDNVKAMQALRAASNLAAVGGASLEDTTNAIAGAWRSGIKGAQSFGQAAATVNAIIGAGNMRMSDFIDAIGTGILPSARTFGVSLKSVGAALALMTDEGIPANSAATRLRMSLSLLGAPSAVASKQLATIGLTGLQLANAMRGPQGIIGAIGLLKSHLDASGLSASESAQLLSHAFGGGRSSSAILTLINNFDVLKRKQDQINKSMGNFGPAVTEQRKTAQAQFALLKSNIDVIGIRIGLALLPPVTKFAHFLATTVVPGAATAATKISNVFSSVIPVKSIEKDWSDLMRFLGLEKAPKPKPQKVAWSDIWHIQDSGVRPSPLLPGKWKPAPVKVSSSDLLHFNSGPIPAPAVAAPKLDTFMGGITKAAPSQAASAASGLSSALSKVNWGKVLGGVPAKVLGGLLDAMGKVNWADFGGKATAWALEFVIGFAGALLDPVTWWHVLQKAWEPLLGILLTVLTLPLGGEGGTIFKGLADVVEHIPILKAFAPLLNFADKLVGPMAKSWHKVLDFVFGPAKRLIGSFFGGAARWLLKAGDDVTLGLLSGVERRWPKLAAWMLGAPGRISRFFLAAGGWLVSKGADIISGLWDGLTKRWPAVTGWVGKIGGRIGGFFGRAGSWLLNAGGHIIEGLLGGIRAKMAGIAGWIKGNVVDPVINWVKHFFGIKSPSTVFHGIGLNLVAGLVRGLATTDGESIAKTIFGSLPKALGSIVKKGLVSIGSLPAKALKLLGGLGGDILGFLGLGGDSGARTGSAAVAQRYAASLLAQYGWSQAQMSSLIPLWNQESGWNADAVNPSSGAYGIPQSLGHGHPYNLGDYKNQIIWGLDYIRQRYGSPAGAWAHEQAFNWYAKGTEGAKAGWAWVGERGPELIKLGGGEHILDAATSMKVAAGRLGGYAKGTSLAKLGRELLRRRHSGVLDTEIANTRRRYQQDQLLANAPGGRHRQHYAKLARSEHHHLKSLEHTLAAEKAYRARLNARISTLQDTVAAARKHGLPGEAAQLEARVKRAQRIVHNIDLWISGKPKLKAVAKPKPAAAAAPTGNMDIADWAAYLDAIHGGAPGLAAFATGSWFVPATAPALVHKGEMIFPADVAQSIRDMASGGGNGSGGQFTGELYLDSGELLGIVDGRIERSDRKFNQRVQAGTGRR